MTGRKSSQLIHHEEILQSVVIDSAGGVVKILKYYFKKMQGLAKS